MGELLPERGGRIFPNGNTGGNGENVQPRRRERKRVHEARNVDVEVSLFQ